MAARRAHRRRSRRWLGIVLAYDSYYWPPGRPRLAGELLRGRDGLRPLPGRGRWRRWPGGRTAGALAGGARAAASRTSTRTPRSGGRSMFSGFMINTWIAATMVAVIAGVVGFFVVLRGSAFAAHAIPHGAFAGAAGAILIGANTILGLGVFAVGGALGIGWLGRRGRHDVATALALVLMLGLGALFLSLASSTRRRSTRCSSARCWACPPTSCCPMAGLGLACILAIAVLYRPLLLTSITPEVSRGARGEPGADGDRLPARGRARGHHDRAGGGGVPDVQPDDRPRRPPPAPSPTARVAPWGSRWRSPSPSSGSGSPSRT